MLEDRKETRLGYIKVKIRKITVEQPLTLACRMLNSPLFATCHLKYIHKTKNPTPLLQCLSTTTFLTAVSGSRNTWFIDSLIKNERWFLSISRTCLPSVSYNIVVLFFIENRSLALHNDEKCMNIKFKNMRTSTDVKQDFSMK